MQSVWVYEVLACNYLKTDRFALGEGGNYGELGQDETKNQVKSEEEDCLDPVYVGN